MIKRYGLLLLLAALSGFGTACKGTAGEICDLKCDCEGCNDEEYDECIVGQEAGEDTASAYDCGDELDELETCIIEDNDCDSIGGDDVFTADCADEAADLADCESDNSDLEVAN